MMGGMTQHSTTLRNTPLNTPRNTHATLNSQHSPHATHRIATHDTQNTTNATPHHTTQHATATHARTTPATHATRTTLAITQLTQHALHQPQQQTLQFIIFCKALELASSALNQEYLIQHLQTIFPRANIFFKFPFTLPPP